MGNGGRRRYWVAVAAILLGGCGSTDPGVTASEANQPSVVGNAQFTNDPSVRILTLTNGLTVYLRENDRPGASAEMRLVINAGSGQEDADQSATAHFLEHMLFNGTTKFPANALIDTLRGFGMQFGADVNAYTTYDETVYELTVPTDEAANLGTGLDVLREWLSAATLDPQQVDDEKGIVLDEWRQSDQTFAGRTAVKAEELFLKGSGYEGHSTGGTDTAIKAMTPELLRRFYDTWYRPDNAAVMVVGDFDMDKVESEIRDRFEGLAARNETTPRAELALAPVGTPAATVYLDPDATTGDVELTLPHEVLFDGSIASARHDTLISLAFDMIATRLTDDVSRGVAPFTSAGVGNNGYVRRLDAPSISVSGDPAQLSASLDAVITEFERVRRFGFDTSEFKRVLRSYTAGLQAEFDGSTTNGDSDYIAQYVDHFLVGYAIPDADTSFQIYSAMYETITPEEVGTAFNELFATAAPHAMLVAPDSLTDTPTDADVVALLAALPTLDIAAREAAADGATELMAPPDPVQETASEQLPSDDALIAPTMLTFDNGARVVLNPTDIADNDIYLSATSPGGLSLVADADVTEAQAAVSVVTSGGVGDLDAVALDTLLSDAAIQLYPSIDQTSEGFTGASTTDDLELLFQLVNQYISKPRFDQVALDSTVSYLQTYVDDPNSDPDLAGFIAYTAARYGPEPRFAVLPTADELAGLDLTTIEKVWRERFSNPSDWVFAISGDFTLEDATDLARRYIGTLAGTGVTEQFKDFQQDPPEGIVTKDVRAGTGDKGTLDLEWSVASTDSRAENVNADVLTSILNIRLTDHIREKLGASYSPSASVSTFSEPDQLVETSMFVTGDPSTLPEISKIVIDDIADMQTSGPTSAEFDAAIAELRKSYDLFDNQTIGDLLAGAANTPAVLADFIDRRSRLADVTAESIKGFIGRAMPIDRYIEVRTVPT